MRARVRIFFLFLFVLVFFVINCGVVYLGILPEPFVEDVH